MALGEAGGIKEHFMMPAAVMEQTGVTVIVLEDTCCFKGARRGDGQGTEPMPWFLPALEDQLSSCLQAEPYPLPEKN